MLTVGDVYSAVDALAPFSTAMDFDNVGLLVGAKSQPVSRVLLALDITAPVVEEAAAIGAQLIVSHHPVIFHPLRGVAAGSPVYELARNGIAAICAHTNLDLAADGVNDTLAAALGLPAFSTIPEDGERLLRVGDLPEEMSGEDFLQDIKKRLGCGCIKVTTVPGKVQRIAVCGGAGGDYAALAKAAGADLYITGEAKHNEVLDAAAIDMPMAMCGHHATEFPVLEHLQQYLQQAAPEAEYILTKHTEEPYKTV